MKKLLILAAVLVLALSVSACGKDDKKNETPTASPTATTAPTETPTPEATATPTEVPAPAVMNHAQFDAAEFDTPVTVQAFVVDTQSWWDNKITVYAADKDGAYFIYEMACSQEDAKLLVPGKAILVSGFKSQWSGEIEIVEATFNFADTSETFVPEAFDATSLLGTDDLIKHQNERVVFKGLKIEAQEDGAAFAYKNAEEKTDDLYFKASANGTTVSFCVEFYLRGKDTDVYKAVEGLKVGDTVDVECYLYWYNGANPHVIGVTVK